jgi:hypothetical protein
MLFHTTEAWNLAAAMYATNRNLVAEGYIADKFEEGKKNGWLCERKTQSALEMFVFADKAYLPPALDIPYPLDENHLARRINFEPENWSRRSKDDPDTLIKLMDYIAPQLISRGVIKNTEVEIRRTAENWRMQIKRDGTYSDAIDGIEHEIADEFVMAQRSVLFAAHGIPTFTGVEPRSSAEPGVDFPESEATLRAVRVYFKEQVRVPAPEDFNQAMRLREHPRIIQWREKVTEWSLKISSGKSIDSTIREEINDANGYIDGPDFATKLLPWWMNTIIIPAAIYERFSENHELTFWIGLTLLGIDVIKGICDIARASVRSEDPLKYKWFLVES